MSKWNNKQAQTICFRFGFITRHINIRFIGTIALCQQQPVEHNISIIEPNQMNREQSEPCSSSSTEKVIKLENSIVTSMSPSTTFPLNLIVPPPFFLSLYYMITNEKINTEKEWKSLHSFSTTLEVCFWIIWRLIRTVPNTDLKMQVRTCGISVHSYGCDLFSCCHLLPRFDLYLMRVTMSIARIDAFSV